LGRWTDSRQDGSQLSVQSYIDWAKRDEPYNFIDNRTTYDLEVQYNWAPLNSHEIITGAGYRFLADDEVGDNNVSFSPQKRRNNLYNLFIQDEITLAPDAWFLTLGSKFEHNDFSGFEIQPNIRLQWHINNDQSIWSSASQAVRTPTPIEEDLTSTLATANGARIAFVPNNDFKSEELTAYEVGYRNQLTTNSSIDLTAFYNDYKHLGTTSIQTPVPVNNGIDPPHFLIPVLFTNNMSGKSTGFEAAFNWAPGENLKISTQYTYLHISLDALDTTQEGAEKIYPRHQGGINIFWNVDNNWTFDTSINYVDELAGFDLDSYINLNINLGRKISQNLYFNLIAQNATDPSHREFSSATDMNMGEIERSIFGKLTWQF
jgi:iron complex outermembrane recepter protein